MTYTTSRYKVSDKRNSAG